MDELNKEQGQETVTEETKTYTQAEVDEMLQKESDRRVSAALKKQEMKNADKIREAQKVANMNAEQKYMYELEQREKAIAAKERELTLAENRNVCSKILSEKGLSLDLVDFVVAESAEDMDANIKRLDKAFKNSVKAEVEKRLGSSVPKQNLPMDNTITKDQFNKLQDPNVLQDIMINQPELWKELTQR